MDEKPGLLLRLLRADQPERVTAAALLIGCGCLGAATVILSVSAHAGKEVSGPMVAACGALSGMIGYAYGRSKAAEGAK